MKISSFDNKPKKISFSSINLSTKETTASLQLLLKYRNADTFERQRLTEHLFTLFDKKLRTESYGLSGKFRSRKDLLQDLYLAFFEGIVESMRAKNPLQYLLEKLNNYKLGKDSYKTEFADHSIDKVINKSKRNKKTFADVVTKDFTEKITSVEETEKAIRKFYRLKADFDKILTDKEQEICNKFLSGFSYGTIADELKISETRVRNHMAVIVAKIKNSRNMTEQNTMTLINEIKNRFSIEDVSKLEKMFVKNPSLKNLEEEEILKRLDFLSETLGGTGEDLFKILSAYPNILSMKPEKIQSNINTSSELLNIDKESFIKIAKKSGYLLYSKPSTLKMNLVKIAQVLDTTEKDIMELAEISPNILSAQDEKLLSNIKKLADFLGISEKDCIKLYKKSKYLLTRNSDNLIANMKRTAELLRIETKDYIKIAKKQTQLIYQSPETIHKNVVQLANLTETGSQKLVQCFMSKPQLFIQKPETIYNHVVQLAEFFNLSIKDCMEMSLKAPQLLVQKPSTIFANVQKYCELLDQPLEKLLQIGRKQPGILLRNPTNVVQKNRILSFYSLIRQKEKSTESFSLASTEDLYSSILRYLIKNAGAKDFPASRKIFETTKDYIINHPDKEYTFELPAHSEYENFVAFSQNLSNELLGKNIFKFKLLTTLT